MKISGNFVRVYNVLTQTRTGQSLVLDLVQLIMPKNNAKPWENGGKGNGKKRNINGRTRRPSIIERNKTDKLSKERFLKLVWRILKISKLFK